MLDPKLLEFCTTDRQKEVISLRIAGKGPAQIAKETGVGEKTIFDIIRRVKFNAASRGYSPDHDISKIVPEGFKLKGVSSYYNSEGQLSGQWVKSQSDDEARIELFLKTLEKAHENYTPFEPRQPPVKVDDDLLSLITITDFHLGMYAWEAETGESWDINIARDVFLNSIHDMINSCPDSSTGFLCQLGDFLHFDSLLQVTPSSGHILDADTRYSKLVELTMLVMTQAVELMLGKFKNVVIVQAEGNHDMAGSIWLRKHLKHIYSKENRVEIIDNEFPYYAYLHGETMLGFHHGHKVRIGQLHKLFAAEPRFREMWGKAKQTYIHTGHLHHEKVVEDGGAITEQHPTLAARDAYAARGGWVSMRGAKVITYHKTDGEIHRTTVRPR